MTTPAEPQGACAVSLRSNGKTVVCGAGLPCKSHAKPDGVEPPDYPCCYRCFTGRHDTCDGGDCECPDAEHAAPGLPERPWAERQDGQPS